MKTPFKRGLLERGLTCFSSQLTARAHSFFYFLTINVFSIPNVQSGLTFWM